MKNNRSESAPLSVWIALASLLLLLVITFSALGENIRANIIAKEIKEMTDTSSCNEEDIKIFAFGSSMFRTGIANRFDAPKWIPDSSNYCLNRTGFLNLTLACAIRNKQIVNAIAATNSDIILIENAFLQYRSRSENRMEESRPRQTIRMIKQYLTAKDQFAMDDYPKPFYSKQLSAEAELKEAAKVIENRKLREISQITELMWNLMDEAPNSKIIIVDIPRPNAIENALNIRYADQLKEQRKILNTLEIDYWEFEQPMSRDLFFDDVHLNEEGQKVYMKWLIDQIEKEMDR